MGLDSVRILCLHGMGESGDVHEILTTNLRNQLPRHWEYIFIDASTPCIAAPGIEEYFEGPFFCHGQTYNVDSTAENVEYLKKVVEEEGPFDGIFGFSQGAAIAGSLIMHHSLDNLTDPPLFKFAVIFSGILPFSKEEGVGRDETEGYGKSTADWFFQTLDDPKAWDRLEEEVDEPYGACWQFNGEDRPSAIEIPTVHVFDPNDSDYMKTQHTQWIKMCRQDHLRVYHHADGHQFPKGKKDTRALAPIIQEVANKSSLLT